MKILVSGGTGFIGRSLVPVLIRGGHEVRVTTRDVDRARAQLGPEVELVHPGDPDQWVEAVQGCDAIVNLAGESIAGGRWTAARKEGLRRSRLATTASLLDACAAAAHRPSVFISASGIGYYGPCGDEKLDETAPAGDDFLARLCVDWEGEANRGNDLGMRVVQLRIGPVLGDSGGFLEKMMLPFRLFAGGPVGSGKQWLSWIHVQDVVGLIGFALNNNQMTGPVNAAAPDARTMAEFSRALGAAMRRPSWIPVPGFALKIMLGEMSEMMLTPR